MVEKESYEDSVYNSISVTRHKIFFVGDVNTGKTSIINRIFDNPFNETYEASIGIDFMNKNIRFRGQNIKIQIWDSAGQEKYKSLIPSYVRNSSIVFIVYDVSTRSSFDNIPNWISFVKNIEKTTMILCGNKNDLSREVEKNEGEELAQKEGLSFFECSAKSNEKIKNMFFSSIAGLPTFGIYDEAEKENLIRELLEENGGVEDYQSGGGGQELIIQPPEKVKLNINEKENRNEELKIIKEINEEDLNEYINKKQKEFESKINRLKDKYELKIKIINRQEEKIIEEINDIHKQIKKKISEIVNINNNKELETMKKKNIKINNKYEELKIKNKDIESKYNELNENYLKIKEENELLKVTKINLNNNDYNKLGKKFGDSFNQVNKEREELYFKLKEKEEENKKLIKEIEEIKKQKKDENNKIKELLNDMDIKNKDIEKNSTLLEKIRKNLSEMVKQRNNLKKELEQKNILIEQNEKEIDNKENIIKKQKLKIDLLNKEINNYKNKENENKYNIEYIKKVYSYECTNINIQKIYLDKGSSEGKATIFLKNNGKESWPINKTKLIFDKNSDIESEDIILNPQKPDETNSYDIIFKQIENYPVGEYKSYLWFNVDGQTYGDKIIITFKIGKKEEKKEIEENMDKIKEFLDNFGLTEGDYSNEKILEHLKKNNFDFDKTFNSLFD